MQFQGAEGKVGAGKRLPKGVKKKEKGKKKEGKRGKSGGKEKEAQSLSRGSSSGMNPLAQGASCEILKTEAAPLSAPLATRKSPEVPNPSHTNPALPLPWTSPGWKKLLDTSVSLWSSLQSVYPTAIFQNWLWKTQNTWAEPSAVLNSPNIHPANGISDESLRDFSISDI